MSEIGELRRIFRDSMDLLGDMAEANVELLSTLSLETKDNPLLMRLTHLRVRGRKFLDRSTKDHGFFWVVMERAFDNWPVDHPFQPDSKEHLYGWILIEVGYRDCTEVETDDKAVATAVAKAIFSVTQREIHCMRVYGTPTGVRVCVPQSGDYEHAGKKKFEAMRSAVYEYIEITLGVKIEELKTVRVA